MVDRSLAVAEVPVRPEFVRDVDTGELEFGDVSRRLSVVERLSNIPAVRKFTILIMLGVVWQAYTQLMDVEPLIFPQFTAVLVALTDAFATGELPSRIWVSVEMLLMGYAAGVFLAVILTTIAALTRTGSDFLGTMTAMFNPLPAIALLPLALLWFGLGKGSMVFVLIHSVLWAVALNTHTGFLAVSETLRMVGRNYGLTGARYVLKILIPAALPSIISGLKLGWAFGWRTLIAAELVFGATSGSGGLGWFIYENRYDLNTDYVFAGLFTVIVIGFFVEAVLFRQLELHTVYKWGMQRS